METNEQPRRWIMLRGDTCYCASRAPSREGAIVAMQREHERNQRYIQDGIPGVKRYVVAYLDDGDSLEDVTNEVGIWH